MKRWLKVLCLVLVLACILPLVVACGKKDETSQGKNPSGNKGTQTVELPDTVSGNTYNGTTFTMYSVEDMFEKKYFFADATTGDGMNDALYQRQQNIEKNLDVKLVYKAAEGVGAEPAYQRYATEIQNAIKNGEEKYQLSLTHAYYAIPSLVTSNSLKPLDELESVVKGMGESYWNKDIMDQVAYKGTHYLGYSNFNLARTYVIAFNKSLYDEYSAAFDGDTMYSLVNNGEWTLSKMSDVAQLVYNNKGSVEKNIYGLTGEIWVPFIGFMHAAGQSVVTKSDDGKYSISWDGNQNVRGAMRDLVSALRNLNKEEEVFFWKNKEFLGGQDPTTVTLSSGNAFMQLLSTNQLIGLASKNVRFGVIPYPMASTDQFDKNAEGYGYRSLNWAGYLAVPANITNAALVGDVMECLSYYSDDVTTYYYEKLLGLKVSELQEDVDMLDIVWSSLCSDFGITFSMIDENNNIDRLVYSIPFCVMGDQEFTTYVSSYTTPARNALNSKINN